MNALESISKSDLKELLNLGWMTHDGMWFYHCCQELGMETTNRINRAAVASMALFEVARLKEALGVEKVENMEQLQGFLQDTMDLVLPKFMRFAHEFIPPDRMRFEWEKGQCFAYKGVKRLGVADQYVCGVIHRIDCWLNYLGVPYTGPGVEKCLMHSRGSCEGEYVFHF